MGEEVYNDKTLLYKEVRHFMMKEDILISHLESFGDEEEKPAYLKES